MCNELDRIAFCIWRIIDSHLSPTSSLIFFSTSFEQPPRTSMMMLYWLTLYSGYRFVSSSLSWLYFVVFSKSLDSLFSSHGQLISITLTCLLVLSMTVASILLALLELCQRIMGRPRGRSHSHSHTAAFVWLVRTTVIIVVVIIVIIIIIMFKQIYSLPKKFCCMRFFTYLQCAFCYFY